MKQGLWRMLLTGWLCLFSNSTKDHQPKNNSIHSEQGPLTAIINEETGSQACLLSNGGPSSLMTQACVTKSVQSWIFCLSVLRKFSALIVSNFHTILFTLKTQTSTSLVDSVRSVSHFYPWQSSY